MKRARQTNRIEGPAVQRSVEAKMKQVRQLFDEKSEDQYKEKAVSLLEECASLGNAEAMVWLAKCCASAIGTEQDVERAEELLSESARKGCQEACFLMKEIDFWRGRTTMNWNCLWMI